ncbi:MAG: GNAT family N-acetyltransferase [Gemmata sp.]
MPRFAVSQAAAHELLPACRLLFAARAEHSRDRLLSDRDASGLFVACGGGRLCGAALVQVLPGALGVAYPPRGEPVEAADAVTAAACEWLRARGVKVCQAFAAAEERPEMAPLERAGFRHVTQLAMLQRDFWPTDPLPRAAEPLSFVAHAPPFAGDFAQTLLATHEATLDCPELNAPRTPGELRAGFATSGGEAYLAWEGGGPVGVVMFEPGAEPGAAELTYLGVVPAARGRGLGAELLKFAVAEASLARGAVLNVSVDVRNTPAMKLYLGHGFREYDRREVWLATWPRA